MTGKLQVLSEATEVTIRQFQKKKKNKKEEATEVTFVIPPFDQILTDCLL